MTSALLTTLESIQRGMTLFRAARGGDQSGPSDRTQYIHHASGRDWLDGSGALYRRQRDSHEKRTGFGDIESFGPTGTHKASSAESIIAHCLRQLKFTRRWSEGRLTDRQCVRLLESVRQYGRAWLRHEAEQFFSSYSHETMRSIDISIMPALDRWFDRNRWFVQELMHASAMSQAGYKLSPETATFVDQLSRVQREYLDRFHADLVQRTPQEIATILGPNDPNFTPILRPAYTGPQAIARAEQYGNAAWQCGQKVMRQRKRESGRAHWERRIMGHPATHHCSDCPPLARLGWQPIGTLPNIGDTECEGFCLCHFEYSDSVEQPEMKPGKPQPERPKKYALKGTQENIEKLLGNPQFNQAMKELKITMKVEVGVKK